MSQPPRQSSILDLWNKGKKGKDKDKGKGHQTGKRPLNVANSLDGCLTPGAMPPVTTSHSGASSTKHPKVEKAATSPPRPKQPPTPAPLLQRQVSEGFQDDWDSHHVKLPCSPHYRYRSEEKELSLWYLISDVLSAEIGDVNDLREAIEAMNPHMDQSHWYFSALTFYFESVLPPDQSALFFRKTLPEMQRLALMIPKVCPSPIHLLETGSPGSVALSQLQVCCLLCHAFFCTMPYRFWTPRARKSKDSDSDVETLLMRSYPSFNFLELYGPQNRGYLTTLQHTPAEACPITDQQAAKFACLVHYFTHFFATHKLADGSFDPGSCIEVTRKVTPDDAFPDWEKSTCCLSPVVCRKDGTIEDSPEPVAEVDFANKYIGGGVLGRGCVQEEIRFLLSPELLITRLLCETLDDNEAVEVRGTTRYSRHTGYGTTFRWAGPFDDPLPVSGSPPMRQSYVLIMDAVNFRGGGLRPGHQYSVTFIQRELCKAYTAFSSLRPFPGTTLAVASGNWGCGVFGGDVQLKSLLQLIAAAQCGVPSVIYYCYGNAELAAALQAMATALAKIPVGKIFTALCEYERARHDAMRSSSSDLAELYRADTLPGSHPSLPPEEVLPPMDPVVGADTILTESPPLGLEEATTMTAPTPMDSPVLADGTYDVFTHLKRITLG